MGYSTNFRGVLKFKENITVAQLSKVKGFLGRDCRDHPEWGHTNLTYIDLKLTDDFSGLEWDGSEKTYDLADKVNLIIDQLRADHPEFGLTGELAAQGEDIEDRWILCFDKNGTAVRRDVPSLGQIITCPDCGHKFELEPK
jgi:hypothetical protein